MYLRTYETYERSERYYLASFNEPVIFIASYDFKGERQN